MGRPNGRPCRRRDRSTEPYAARLNWQCWCNSSVAAQRQVAVQYGRCGSRSIYRIFPYPVSKMMLACSRRPPAAAVVGFRQERFLAVANHLIIPFVFARPVVQRGVVLAWWRTVA